MPPFIGRRRDFYIPKIPLGPKEYSWCEHVDERLLHLIHLQDCH
jgi:hypothetical protein